VENLTVDEADHHRGHPLSVRQHQEATPAAVTER
jgi:hypothetical protein